MHIIKPLTMSCTIVMMLSSLAYAKSSHDHHQHHIAQQPKQSVVESSHQHHHREHGGEIYQVTHLENAWYTDNDSHGAYLSKFKSMIGTDENRLYLKANLSKTESAEAVYDVSAFYSRMLSDFWDGQIGVRYRDNRNIEQDSEQFDAVFGLHGLAPYFFESDLHVYLGQNNYVALGLDFERDILWTQKLITQPYIEMDIIFSDDSNYASKTGLAELHTGLKTRYEINKRIKPFVDIGYVYEKGQIATSVQAATLSTREWKYGVGLELVF